MKFLDKKEQVLDTVLTPYGEYLLSAGQFSPEYYAFYDDNILYETQYGRPDETPQREQNSIQPRIQDNTPQLETQVVFSDRDVYNNKSLKPESLGLIRGIAPSIEQSYAELSRLSDAYIFERQNYGLLHPLGTSDKLATKSPAWAVTMLRGEIDSSTDALLETASNATPIVNIPQLNVTLTYEIDTVVSTEFVSDTELAVSFPNGEILDVKPEILLAQIKELNSEFTKDNFEIEVFEVTTDDPAGAEDQTFEVLRKLKFRRSPSLIQNDILLDEDDLLFDTEPIGPDNVEYYFNINVDEKIDSQLICSSIAESKKQGRFINVDFECEDTKNIAFVDIYSTDAVSEPCPDLDNPCDDESGTVY